METTERERHPRSAPLFIVLTLATAAVGLALVGLGLRPPERGWLVALGVWLLIKAGVAARGFFIVNPNESVVLVLFGNYRGTVRENGLHWANPLYVRHTVSLRIRNQDSDVLKVNDAAGNPVEIAAVINWQVFDTSKELFDV